MIQAWREGLQPYGGEGHQRSRREHCTHRLRTRRGSGTCRSAPIPLSKTFNKMAVMAITSDQFGSWVSVTTDAIAESRGGDAS
jgi:hypothetical protein